MMYVVRILDSDIWDILRHKHNSVIALYSLEKYQSLCYIRSLVCNFRLWIKFSKYELWNRPESKSVSSHTNIKLVSGV